MREQLIIDLLEVLEKHKIISPPVLRNEKIRWEFRQFRIEGKRSKWIREYLADKYFVSEKTIEAVVYAKPSLVPLKSINSTTK